VSVQWRDFNNNVVGTWYSLVVSGLSFTPKLVICCGMATNYQVSIWNNGLPWVSGATTLPANGIIIVNSNFYNFNLESAGYVNSGGFKMPMYYSGGAISWYAYG